MTYLVLSRSLDEAITIGDDIRVVVLGVKGSQVRLGIEAPRNVAVDREEIHQRKEADKRAGYQPLHGHDKATANAPPRKP